MIVTLIGFFVAYKLLSFIIGVIVLLAVIAGVRAMIQPRP